MLPFAVFYFDQQAAALAVSIEEFLQGHKAFRFCFRSKMRGEVHCLQLREIEIVYVLVGPDEADPQQGKLSMASPLGKNLLGKKVGDRFLLTLPRATVPYHVLKVERL